MYSFHRMLYAVRETQPVYNFHRMLYAVLMLSLASLCARAQPVSPGDPVADPAGVVTVGSVRFTILTEALVRMEYRPPGSNPPFEDRQTMLVWQRKLPVPAFTHSVNSSTGAVQIATDSFVLTYTGTGSEPFTADNLQVQLLRPAVNRSGSAPGLWHAGMSSAGDAGNLYGTFHTLDTLGGVQNMNCTVYDVDGEVNNNPTIPHYPCDFGLVSTSGWALVDDSRTAVIEADDQWVHSQTAGVCDPAPPPAAGPLTECTRGQFNAADEDTCTAAGCCWLLAPVGATQLNLYYSASRQDHFTDATCAGCDGAGYVLLHSQGWAVNAAINSSDAVTIPLNLYWNGSPSPSSRSGRARGGHGGGHGVGGAGGDNVVSTLPPAQPGYNFVRVQGYIYSPALPQPPNTNAVKLYYNAALLDHYTTASAADEADAQAKNYSLVSLLGYMPAPAANPPNVTGDACMQRSGSTDWYLFTHGADYAGALRDFTAIAGAIPIPRRHWAGISWSRWGNELTQDVMYQQVANLSAASFPCDTFITDMQWHLKPDWTGWTWDPVAFPNHTYYLQFLHEHGLQTALNLHDAQGVQSYELRYAAMASANGIDPASNVTVAFDIANQTYADTLHKLVLEPLMAEGVDFWWTDWQQGLPGVSSIANMVPTMLLNHYRFANWSAPGSSLRGIHHSRYGGLGSHRYPSMFGGDVQQAWESLGFMVYFTATAANVGVQWGHEIMRDGGSPTDNSELFTRVIQFGAFSPTFTMWGNSGQDDNIWFMQEPFITASQIAMSDRNRLLPYRYTEHAKSFVSGVAPIHPMYYDYPWEPAAYSSVAAGQYMLGSDMLVAPIATPADSSTGLSSVDLWLPPGRNWVEWAAAHTVYTGGQVLRNYTADIYTVPAFVAGGSILPLLPYASSITFGIASQQYSAIEWTIYPGADASGSSATWLYEDDGFSNDYKSGVYANTTASYSTGSGSGGTSCVNALLGPTTGSYTGMIASRNYTLVLLATPAPPATVTADGVALPQSPTDGQQGTWFTRLPAATRECICCQPLPQRSRPCRCARQFYDATGSEDGDLTSGSGGM